VTGRKIRSVVTIYIKHSAFEDLTVLQMVKILDSNALKD
jgi:hypothetical protein